MKKDISFSIPKGTEEADELLKLLKQTGTKVVNLNDELNNAIQQYVQLSKRPLLAILLGSSILNQDHLEQVAEVLKNQKFDSLDVLLQVVAGDLKVGHDIANLIRSNVAGKLTCIIPVSTSGPGTLMALQADEVVGLKSTVIGPIYSPSIHPCIIEWKGATGQIHPVFNENQSEYSRIYKDAYKYVISMREKGFSQTLLDNLAIQKELTAADIQIPKLAQLGLKARFAVGKDRTRIDDMFRWIFRYFDDLIAVFR